MQTVQKITPSGALQDYVRHYNFREAAFEERTAITPLPARPEQLLQFFFRDRYEIFNYASGQKQFSPSVVIVGPQTYRAADLLMKGRIASFVVVFQPTGFHRLFRLPMIELTDRAYEAADLIGAEIRYLHERLCQTISLKEIICTVESFLTSKLATVQPFHSVQRAAAQMLSRNGQINLDHLVRATGLSQRQFERKFSEQVGISPKLYSRIIRFNYALRLKQELPDITWTDITYEAGYFDQMHLVKDFKALSGETPSRFLRLVTSNLEIVTPRVPGDLL